MRLAIYLSQGARVMVSTVHGQSVLGPRESERVVECYWLYGALKLRNSIDAVI